MDKPVKDTKGVRQMSEPLEGRRAGEEKRLCPRFLTADGLTNTAERWRPTGILICRAETSRSVPDVEKSAPGQADSRGKHAQAGPFEKISDMYIIDFSEKGAQVYFECDNQARILTSEFFLQVGITRVAVCPSWYQLSPHGNTAGFEFNHQPEQSCDLARLLVYLSDDLLNFVINEHIPSLSILNSQVCTYAYLSIFYNLRLKFLECIALFNKARERVEQFVNSHHHEEMMHIFLEFESLRSLHLKQARALSKDKDPNATLEPFVKPFRELGGGISGKAQQLRFHESDVLSVLADSIVFWDWKVHPSCGLAERVKPARDAFMALRTILPGVFEGEAFDNQFDYYSFLIRSTTQLKNRLIDLVSAPMSSVETARVRGRMPELLASRESDRVPALGTIPRLMEKGRFEEIGTPALEEKLVEAYGRSLGVESASGEGDITVKGLQLPYGQSIPPPRVGPGPNRPYKYLAVLLAAVVAFAVAGLLSRPGMQVFWKSRDVGTDRVSTRTAPADAVPQEVPPRESEAGNSVEAKVESGAQPSVLPSDTVPDKVSESLTRDVSGGESEPVADERGGNEAPEYEAAVDAAPADSRETALPAGEVVEEPLPEATPAAPPRKELVHRFEIEAGQKCWIQVKIDGEKAWSAMMKPGDRFDWEVKERIDILVGNSGGVRVKWDGQLLGQVGMVGQPVRLTLPNPQLISKVKAD